jgi:hypothetical protein
VKRILTAATLAFLAVLLAAPAVRAGDSPEGKWWKNPRVTAELGLSPDQAVEIEKIFVHSRPKLIDLRGDLEKKQLELRSRWRTDRRPVRRRKEDQVVEIARRPQRRAP